MMYISELKNGEVIRTPAQVKFDKEYDVLVCGVGTAGAHALAISAQNGLDALGIESFTCVGGTTTIGGVKGHYFGTPGGKFEEMDEVINKFSDIHFKNRTEARKLALQNIITESGAEILYESSVIGVYLNDDKVAGVRVITPDGVKNFASKVLMDCTGDAYVVNIAGCKTEYGRKIDGLTQPYSMVSTMKKGTGVTWSNIDYGRVDQRNDVELSKAILFSRAHDTIKSDNYGKRIIHMPLIGCREGSRIIAEETVTLSDIFDGKYTDQPMFYSYADLDKHGWDIAFDGDELCDWSVGANLGAYNVTIPVPFKAIIPKDIDGLLVPCRALGVDRDISSCVRMVRDMKKVGEAAADVAYLAIKHGCSLKDISYEELSAMLVKSGCLDHRENKGYCIDGVRDENNKRLPPIKVEWIKNKEDLKQRLSTDTPGIAIWSSRLLGDDVLSYLEDLLESDDENVKKHSAFALAIKGNNKGADVLRQMVYQRDGYTLKDCRKQNQQRGCMAIYHLGRLCDTEIVDEFIDIITNPNEVLKDVYQEESGNGTRYIIPGFNNKYFQFVTQSVAALIRIGDKHKTLRDKISNAFEEAFFDESYIERITTKSLMSSEGSMTLNIKNVAQITLDKWKNGTV